MIVPPERPPPIFGDAQNPKYSASSTADPAIRLDKLRRPFEVLDRNVTESRRHLLVWGKIDQIPRNSSPPPDPPATERAIAVVDEQGFTKLCAGHHGYCTTCRVRFSGPVI